MPLLSSQDRATRKPCTLDLDLPLPPPPKLSSAPVRARLYGHAAKAASKLAAARREADHPKDESTGVPLFVPQIGRAPTYSRNHAALPIGDYLYGMRCALAAAEAATKKPELIN